MSDFDALNSIHHPAMPDPEDFEVKDRQQRYLFDSGSNYQAGGYIQFQPVQAGVSEQWVDWSDSSTRLEVPVQIAFPNYPTGTAAPGIAFKAGYVSFISNITMTAQGKTVIFRGRQLDLPLGLHAPVPGALVRLARVRRR